LGAPACAALAYDAGERVGATEPPRLGDHGPSVEVSSLFRGALCEQLARGPARRIAAGRLLYSMGGDARSVFLIRRGLVKTSMISSRGQELTLRLYTTGDILGELCLCTGQRREQAVALEPSDVVEIPIERLTARLQQDPQAALEFAAAVCQRLAAAEERLRSLATDPALGRLVRTLLALAADLGEPTAQGTQLRHHFAQEELARLVGARREVISGLMNRLRGKGLISYTRRGRIVVDRQRLIELRDRLDVDSPVGGSL
jgi:CRP/FNR family transcriptional regulator, cyclic AMP receptor protein